MKPGMTAQPMDSNSSLVLLIKSIVNGWSESAIGYRSKSKMFSIILPKLKMSYDLRKKLDHFSDGIFKFVGL